MAGGGVVLLLVLATFAAVPFIGAYPIFGFHPLRDAYCNVFCPLTNDIIHTRCNECPNSPVQLKGNAAESIARASSGNNNSQINVQSSANIGGNARMSTSSSTSTAAPTTPTTAATTPAGR